ncbi:TetR family transcriptional regulator [Nocardioides dongxiaopingii]|uniref:TetR family transcriptional regulator n=1 Tax=Nocardioides dongxiaopingii TaxID=2576036 RepID=UPI001FE55F03|nr:TetR family transcriptional regulator [Nocardioides dongxiaopingii]
MTELAADDERHAGAAVRQARRAAGLTLRELADRVGVSVGTMSAVENGKVGLTVVRLRQIAVVLDVSPARLLAPPVGAGPAIPPAGHRDWRAFPPLALDPVLAAAVGVLRETGYHGATMRMIAAAADISIAGIYHHHRSKQSLLVALVNLVMEDLTWRVLSAGAEAATPADRFERMVEALALFHAVRAEAAFIVATEVRSLEAPDRRRNAATRRRIQAALDAAAAAAVDDGTFGVALPHHAARAVATMCMALPYWYSPEGSQPPAEIAAEYAAMARDLMRPTR